MSDMKRCPACGVEKPLDEFHRSKRSRDGRGFYCKDCSCAKTRAWNAAHRELARSSVRAWQSAHPEYSTLSSRKQRAARPEHYRAQAREGHLRRKYGLSLDAVEAMYRMQRGCCALCDRPMADWRSTRLVHVDHDHITNRVRGLTHVNCNTALGVVEDVGVEKFVAYLHRAARARLKVAT